MMVLCVPFTGTFTFPAGAKWFGEENYDRFIYTSSELDKDDRQVHTQKYLLSLPSN